MHLMLTGATGLVGSAVLDAMLRLHGITKITILSRRRVLMAEQASDPRVDVVIQEDFTTYDSKVLERFQGASGVIWALGVSQTQVPRQDYVAITKTYALAAAEAFADLAPAGEPFRFIYVSAGFATQTPGLFSPYYAVVKGETESLLSQLREVHPRLKTESVRVGYVDATQHSAIQPYIPDIGLLYKTLTPLAAPPIRLMARWMHSPSEPFGVFLTEMAMGKYDDKLTEGGRDMTTLPGGLRVLENEAFRRLAGLQ